MRPGASGRELLKSYQFEHDPNRDHRFKSLIEAIGWVVGRSNPTESLRTKIAAANFKLKARLSCELLLSSKSGRLAIVTNKVRYFLTFPLASNCFR